MHGYWGCEVDHSHVPSFEIKNEWIVTTFSIYAFVVWCLSTGITLFLLLPFTPKIKLYNHRILSCMLHLILLGSNQGMNTTQIMWLWFHLFGMVYISRMQKEFVFLPPVQDLDATSPFRCSEAKIDHAFYFGSFMHLCMLLDLKVC
jgi:hypothetical protein